MFLTVLEAGKSQIKLPVDCLLKASSLTHKGLPSYWIHKTEGARNVSGMCVYMLFMWVIYVCVVYVHACGQRSLTEPGIHEFSKASWPIKLQESICLCSPSTEVTDTCQTQLLTGVLSHSCMYCEPFTNWAISSGPGISFLRTLVVAMRTPPLLPDHHL